MANGKPGDGPFSDIVVHGLDVYSPSIDALVREIAEASDETRRHQLADRLYQDFHPIHAPDLAELERFLIEWRQRLASDES